MEFYRIPDHERQDFAPKIAALEATAYYPLGEDMFQIDHGQNYFSFFDRLGDLSYYVGLEGDRIVAVGAGILRQVSLYMKQPSTLVWYLCDLKVHPDYQGRHLSVRLLSYAIQENVHRCDRAYLVSMNPAEGRPNRLVKVLERYPHLNLSYKTKLNIYSLSADQMTAVTPWLVRQRGNIFYRSLRGIKDLRLQRSGRILPLLHVAWGTESDQAIHPIPGCVHMFCLPEQDILCENIAGQGVFPQATASVVAHNLESDWNFILTSDI